jgi:excinuclease ABC subunit C
MQAGHLHAKLDALPDKTGVYLFKDQAGKTIYIGKAKNLRNRVRSYFQSSRHTDAKTEVLKHHIRDLEYITTDSEVEALILESTLVKRQRPRYNVNLKDDKAFLHIKLTVQEPFPRVLLTRRVLGDGAIYFGPYLPASLARNTVKIINRHFLLRTCDIQVDGRLERPCLEYHIKRCLGPCVAGLCTGEEYRRAVKDVVLLLEGKNEQLIGSLTQKMAEASENQRFEAAAFYRDRIQMVKSLAEKQKMIMSGVDDVDVFAYHRQHNCLALQLFTIRSGKLVGKREFYWEDLEFFSPSQFLRDALQQYYLSASLIPGEIHVPVEIEDQELMSEWLTYKRPGRRRVRIICPQRGEKHNLLLLAEENARSSFDTRFRIERSAKGKVLERLQKELGLPGLPGRIEAFDISNFQGTDSVASLVVCENGKMKKSDYRKFQIRTVEGADDFASIFEVVSRRYKRLVDEGTPIPDMILIDGGKGQLHQAYLALAQLGIEDVSLAGIAKKEEHVFLQGHDEPVILDRSSPALHLLQEIRDEAHRFAVQYHRRRRSMRDFKSELDDIPGIGEKRKKRLLQGFGSIRRIREATVEELIPFLGVKLAQTAKERLTADRGETGDNL